MKKGVQFFSEEYLKRCEGVTPDQIIEFLENYRMLISNECMNYEAKECEGLGYPPGQHGGINDP